MTKRNMRSRSSRRPYNNPATTTVYRGPVRLPTQDGADTSTVRLNMTWSSAIDSTAGSFITGYITGGDVSSCSDWTASAALYREFRVLAIEARWVPDYNGAYSGALIHSSGAIAPSRSAISVAPSTLDQVVQKTTWKVYKSSTGVKAHWKMNGIEEAGFSNTTTPSDQNRGGIVWFLDGLSASSRYGHFHFTFLIELRGRK